MLDAVADAGDDDAENYRLVFDVRHLTCTSPST